MLRILRRVLTYCFIYLVMCSGGCTTLEVTSETQPTQPQTGPSAGGIFHSSQSASGRRTALVIGNSTYGSGPLKNPTNDADDMANTLDIVGFDVELLHNASHRQMEEAIRRFGFKLHQGGVGLFYYAGHGIQVDGENYLIPTDTELMSDKDVKYKAVNLGQVLDEMAAADNRLNIVILDACRNNPLPRSFRSVNAGLAKVDGPIGTLIAYATSPGSVAIDGEDRNGIYTKHLLGAMSKPGLSLLEVFEVVMDGVKQETLGEQTPWISTSVSGGNFYFSPPASDKTRISNRADKAQGEPAEETVNLPTENPSATAPYRNPQPPSTIAAVSQPSLPADPVLPYPSDSTTVMVLFEEHNMRNPSKGTTLDLSATETALMKALQTDNSQLVFIDRAQHDINIAREKAHAAMDGDAASAKAIGLLFGADYIITGKSWANTKSLHHTGENLESAQATVTARMVRVATGEIIASENASGSFAPVIDPVVDNGKALARAANELAGRLTEKLPTAVSRIQVTLKKVEHTDLPAFSAILDRINGVKHVQQLEFRRPVALYYVTATTSAQPLADALTGKRINGRMLTIAAVGNGSLVLQLQ